MFFWIYIPLKCWDLIMQWCCFILQENGKLDLEICSLQCQLLHCLAVRVIDSLLIGGVFKKWCQYVCNMLVWICGLRRGPSNLNYTLRSSHINLITLCKWFFVDELGISLSFWELVLLLIWNQALVLCRTVHFLNTVYNIINYPSFSHCNSQSFPVYWVRSYFKTSKTPV
jgi:hypothetical protein